MTARARVAINARHLSQALTGVQRFAHEISDQLWRIRDDVVFVAPPGRLRETDYPVVSVGRTRGHAWEQFELPSYLLGSGRPLLVNLTSTAPILYRRQVMAHHDITYVRHPESFSRPFRLLYAALTPPALRASLRIITVSEFSRREISAHYRISHDTISVVPNAVGHTFSPGAATDREPYLLAVSSPNRHKNFDGLVTAFERADLDPRFTLKIVGAQAASFSRTDRTSSTARVEYLGRLSDADLSEVYRRATAFVFPSFYEGFGIPPLEAQAAGTPVIASRVPAVVETLSDSALYFDPHDVNDMRSAIERITRDERLQEELAERGTRNVRRFSWEKSAAELDAVIEDALSALRHTER